MRQQGSENAHNYIKGNIEKYGKG